MPLTLDFTGSLDLETREITFEDSRQQHYTGAFSENGRVLHLRSNAALRAARSTCLVHEETLRQFESE